MDIITPGDSLLSMIRSTKNSLIIVAPYLKATAFEKIIDAISQSTISLICVTRWLPQDIATGVSDLEIYDLIEREPRRKLFLHPHLHAKYYRGDERCLVGSANLTLRGLGWTVPSNLELLIELPYNYAGLSEWETNVIETSVQATYELRDKIKIEADRLKNSRVTSCPPEVEEGESREILASQWLPRCPTPERLWEVYLGQGQENIVTSAWTAAQEDLIALNLPSGLTKDMFELYVASVLKQMPLIAKIDNLTINGLANGKAQTLLEEYLGDAMPYSAAETWRVLKLWLMYFFGDNYRLEVKQEVMIKGRTIST